MSVFYDLSKTPRNILNQAIVRAIASENNGALFDPSDLSTLYQDAAGTIPVTAVEQPVGLMLDKARGLMLGPEEVPVDYLSDTSLWTVTNGTSQATEGKITFTASGGGTLLVVISGSSSGFKQGKYRITGLSQGITVDRYFMGRAIDNTATVGDQTCVGYQGNAELFAFIVYSPPVGATFSIEQLSVRELYGYHATQPITASRPVLSARKNVLLATETLATQSVTSIAAQYTLSFTGTGIVTLSGTATGTLTGTGVNDRVSLTVTPTAGTLTLTVSGSVTNAQLELGTSAGPYQRVNTATDYDTDERYFKKYIRFDGVDDYLNLPYMGLYAGGSASIITGRDDLSQATDTYIISERSTTDVNPKYYPSRQLSSGGNMDSYITDNAGTVVLDTTGSAFGGASNAVIRSVIDAGNSIKLLKNGAVAASDNYTRGGTLTLNTTTIGASVSTTTSNYAKMKLYGVIITKSALTDSQRVACERYLVRKSGVQL